MLIEVNSTVAPWTGSDSTEIEEIVESMLERFKERLTRVEIHISDANGPKGGPDKRCQVEGRLAGRKPIGTSADGLDVREAVTSAVEKLSRQITTDIEKSRGH